MATYRAHFTVRFDIDIPTELKGYSEKEDFFKAVVRKLVKTGIPEVACAEVNLDYFKER